MAVVMAVVGQAVLLMVGEMDRGKTFRVARKAGRGNGIRNG